MSAYDQGYEAGKDNADRRSCPYEGTKSILDWLEGWNKGQEARNLAPDSEWRYKNWGYDG